MFGAMLSVASTLTSNVSFSVAPSGLGSTRAKIFSGASTTFGAAPNTQACAVDIALPGVLPVLNRVGGRFPLPCTGVGRVLLAFAPHEVQEQVLGHARAEAGNGPRGRPLDHGHDHRDQVHELGRRSTQADLGEDGGLKEQAGQDAMGGGGRDSRSGGGGEAAALVDRLLQSLPQ